MTIAYFTVQGATISKEGETIFLQKEKERVAQILIKDIDAIVAFGHISVSPPALDLILKNAIPITFISLRGRLKGRIVPAGDKNVHL